MDKPGVGLSSRVCRVRDGDYTGGSSANSRQRTPPSRLLGPSTSARTTTRDLPSFLCHLLCSSDPSRNGCVTFLARRLMGFLRVLSIREANRGSCYARSAQASG